MLCLFDYDGYGWFLLFGVVFDDGGVGEEEFGVGFDFDDVVGW